MPFKYFILCWVLVANVLCSGALAGPLIVGGGAGSEENQYVALWYNRSEIFGRCLQSTACGMTTPELITLQKLATTALQWAPFRFYPTAAFAAQAQGLINPARTSFVAFSAQPGVVIFDLNRLYENGNKYTYDQKLLLLTLIAAQQSGLAPTQAQSVIQKLVSFWQVRWSKLDLRVLGHPDLQIWVQQGDAPGLLLFDQSSVVDLLIPLLAELNANQGCPSGRVLGVQITSPFWSGTKISGDLLSATFAGSVKALCGGGVEAPTLGFEMDLVFKHDTAAGWLFQKPAFRIHLSSLGALNLRRF